MDRTIKKCEARAIKDSRGKPTIEVLLTSDEHEVSAAVPSGKSTGSKEALEKRDADGVGVNDAVAAVNDRIAPKIIGEKLDPFMIDRLLLDLDGTDNKSALGANAILGVSIAATKLSATTRGVHLWKYIAELTKTTPSFPKLYMNVVNGGAHANFRLPFQEHIVVPTDDVLSKGYARAQKVLGHIGTILKERAIDFTIGDEGGYSPHLDTLEGPFALLSDAIAAADGGAFIAIDAAANELLHDGAYELLGKRYSVASFSLAYKELVQKFNLRSIEDPFEESDTKAFSALHDELGDSVLVVGDDITVSNPGIIAEVAEENAANAVIIKPNQIGTLMEVYDAVNIARGAGWQIIVSHRSGETMDPFIADLAVGLGAFGIKAGAPTQPERTVKYERLLAIEKEYGTLA